MLELDIAASMGLQNLQYEPQRLLSEAERLNAELESLVMDNYRIFVENLTCSVHLRSEVRKQLLQNIPFCEIMIPIKLNLHRI